LPPGNLSGDLIVEIVLKPDPYIEVKERDYHYRALIGLDVFIEGGKIVVPTPGGATAVEIPPRMSDGRILKIAGKGLPAFASFPTGDLYLKIELCVPKRLSRKERQILAELMALPGFRPPVDADGYIARGD
jgi:DnaJ-class molecular chaperone